MKLQENNAGTEQGVSEAVALQSETVSQAKYGSLKTF